jgi:hypothetical protein
MQAAFYIQDQQQTVTMLHMQPLGIKVTLTKTENSVTPRHSTEIFRLRVRFLCKNIKKKWLWLKKGM